MYIKKVLLMNPTLRNILLIASALVLMLGAFAFGAFFFLTHIPWVDLSVLEHYKTGTPSVILDDEGKEWARFELDCRKPVPLSDMPDHLIKAFLAAEDHNFFSHSGISLRGITRSIIVNTLKRRKVQGASTITQQLVRLLFFDHKKTFSRKVKEQLLSLAVERQFTKELILETYLNHLYFGCGIYGVESASQRFWGKSVQKLTVDEAATLAAIIRSPVRNCPLTHPEKTQSRRDVILRSMQKLGYISVDSCDELQKKPVAVKTDDAGCIAPHVREYVRIFAENLVGRNVLYAGGITIKTTLNSALQREAQTTFRKHVTQLKSKLSKDVDGALITLDVVTSDIKALVGGYDFKSSQFNRALHAQRQFGSIFKPIIYAVGMEQGRCFNEVEIDEPITIDDNGSPWTPQNFNKKFEGPMTLAHALSVSSNPVSVKMLMKAGIPNVITYLSKFHLSANAAPYPSLALGCIDGPAIEVAGIFTTIAHKGTYCPPRLIEWVKDASHKKIWKTKRSSEPVLTWSTSCKVAQALSISFERYKDRHPGKWGTVQVFGKTGTTNQSRTCWFGGATPSYATVIYIGRDNNQSLGNDVYPSQTAFPLWLEYNSRITHPIQIFDSDPSLSKITIDPFTGAEVNHDSRGAITILR
jgi:penicillin-binding protein 1A